jgi:hypothetical protein
MLHRLPLSPADDQAGADLAAALPDTVTVPVTSAPVKGRRRPKDDSLRLAPVETGAGAVPLLRTSITVLPPPTFTFTASRPGAGRS